MGVTRNPPSPTLGTQVGLKMAPWELAGRATRGEGKAEGAENPGGRGRREPRRDKGDRTMEPEIPDHKEVGIGTKRSSETGPRHSTQKPARRLSHSTHTINILCNERTEHTHTHTQSSLGRQPTSQGHPGRERKQSSDPGGWAVVRAVGGQTLRLVLAMSPQGSEAQPLGPWPTWQALPTWANTSPCGGRGGMVGKGLPRELIYKHSSTQAAAWPGSASCVAWEEVSL